jgi:hypothetical protein
VRSRRLFSLRPGAGARDDPVRIGSAATNGNAWDATANRTGSTTPDSDPMTVVALMAWDESTLLLGPRHDG